MDEQRNPDGPNDLNNMHGVVDRVVQEPPRNLYSWFIIKNTIISKDHLNFLVGSYLPKHERMLDRIMYEIVISDHVEAFAHLIQQGYDVDTHRTLKKQTIIHIAVLQYAVNISEWIKFHLTDHFVENLTDDYGFSYFHIASFLGLQFFIRDYIAAGYDINARYNNPGDKERNGFTPLHFAVMNRQIDTVRYLLEHGAHCNSQDALGKSPLLLACTVAHVFKRISPNILMYKPQWESELKILLLLLESKEIDINLRDNNGNNAMLLLFKNSFNTSCRKLSMYDRIEYDASQSMYMLLCRQIAKFHHLLEYGVNLAIVNNENENILHRIIGDLKNLRHPLTNKDISFVDGAHAYLINRILNKDQDVDVNLKNVHGQTPLFLAVSLISLDVVKVLLDHNADVNSLKYMKFSDDWKSVFSYPKIAPNFPATRNMIAIVDLLAKEGYILSVGEHLRILKFLIHEEDDCDCFFPKHLQMMENNLQHCLYYGRPKHAVNILKKMKAFKEYHQIINRILSARTKYMRMHLNLARMVDRCYPEEYYSYLDSGEHEFYYPKFFADVRTELASLKKSSLILSYQQDGCDITLSLYDLLAEDLDLINSFDFPEDQIDRSARNYYYYGPMLRGQMALALSVNYFYAAMNDYLPIVMGLSSRADKFCSRITRYLEISDIWNVYLAAADIISIRV